MSLELVAKVELSLQSTSRIGSLWKANCWTSSPESVFQTIAVLSIDPVSKRAPFLLKRKETTGQLCLASVCFNSPASFQMRAAPSNEPEAKRLPVGFQSTDVMSAREFSRVLDSCERTEQERLKKSDRSASVVEVDVLISSRPHNLTDPSADPVASFEPQLHVNNSFWCPLSSAMLDFSMEMVSSSDIELPKPPESEMMEQT
mmetsp:Transcript_2701/g.4811  ORF Transcript_2701/g.4811 Transcript_2701/m.4811 type:complete len:202 (-) Transcript_2701:315-920(-)